MVYQTAEEKGRNPVVNQYVYYPDGMLKEASGGGIKYCYEYTENGLLKCKSSGKKTLLQYGYDRNRNITCLTDVTGKTVRYAYDVMNRLERVEDTGQSMALAAYQFTPFGQIQALDYGNGVRNEYQYAEDGTLSSLVTVTNKGEVLLNYDYAYDGNGNCVRKSSERYQNEYAYDRMNRLEEAVYDGRWETYAYDFAGNRLRKETNEKPEFYAYNTKNQLLQKEKGTEVTQYHYDAQGNLREESGDGRKQYVYDSLNRLYSVSSESVIQKNRYDVESLRYETEENDKIIRFIFDHGELTSEEKAGGKIRYIHGNNKVVSSEGADTGYHIQDEAGSTLFILDREQNLRKSYRYDAFGKVLEEEGEFENRLTYTGQMYDGATGQYYLRARFYNPVIGRFLQEDVYRGDGLNLYAYCANNPVMYYDPSGYWVLCPNGKLVPTNDNFDEIRNYRDMDLSEIDPKYLADPEFIVDMPFTGKGNKNANSQGWLRNQKYFYQELSKTHPELFSDANMLAIANGDVPIVDGQFMKHFPQYEDYLGDIIRHHHIGGGGQAAPVPDSLHEGFVSGSELPPTFTADCLSTNF